MKINIEKRVSKKTEKLYYVAYVDLGYREFPISFDLNQIAELANLSVGQLVDRIEREKKIII